MKRIFLSIVLCVGVGFAMTGSPAHVNDDNGSAPKVNNEVRMVSKKNTVHKGRELTKEEVQKKEIDIIKTKKALVDGNIVFVNGIRTRSMAEIKKRKPVDGPEKGCSDPGQLRPMISGGFPQGLSGRLKVVDSKIKPNNSADR